jgi:hypothetical protein
MNFYTLVKYFWVLVFIVNVLAWMLNWRVEDLWRVGASILMIIIFAVVDNMQEDKKLLVKR